MNRDEFLAKVRQASASGRHYRVTTDPWDSARVGYVGGGDDLVACMFEEVAAVGGKPLIVDDLQQAASAVCEIATARQIRQTLFWQHPLLDAMEIRTRLAAVGIEGDDFESLVTLDPDVRRDRVLAAELGVSSATWAIAETGTLVMASEPGRERIVSLLPRTHVAIIERRQILPDLFDVFDALGQRDTDSLPSNVTLITGPSKTGDLEMKLITGVHGPGEWHVILVR